MNDTMVGRVEDVIYRKSKDTLAGIINAIVHRNGNGRKTQGKK
jgi:hypothetical protein